MSVDNNERALVAFDPVIDTGTLASRRLTITPTGRVLDTFGDFHAQHH